MVVSERYLFNRFLGNIDNELGVVLYSIVRYIFFIFKELIVLR